MFAIGHLTDIHIATPLDPILQRSDAIANAIGSKLTGCSHVLLVVTGDIAQSGKEDQYQLATVFLRSIRDKIRSDYDVETSFVVCPGNHDCDFSIDQEFRDLALKKMAGREPPSDRLIEECTSVQQCYFQFLKELCGVELPRTRDRLRYEVEFDIDGKRINFDCVNLSWVSRIPEEKVSFPLSIIPEKKTKDGVTIAIMHHPFNWLHPASYRAFRKKIRTGSDIVFAGHEHEWNVMETLDTESGHCLLIDGAVLQDTKEPERSGFSVSRIDLSGKIPLYQSQQFDWSRGMYVPLEVPGWEDFKTLHVGAVEGAWRFLPGRRPPAFSSGSL